MEDKKRFFMKKNWLLTISALIISTLCLGFFSSCDKDTDCTLAVTVIDSKTGNPFSGIHVKIYNQSSTSDDIQVIGYTDANGRFKTSFKAPGLFQVVATRETGLENPISRMKYYNVETNSVRLIDGETVECKVALDTSKYVELNGI